MSKAQKEAHWGGKNHEVSANKVSIARFCVCVCVLANLIWFALRQELRHQDDSVIAKQVVHLMLWEADNS